MFDLITNIAKTYYNNFPNLQYYRGLGDAAGLDIEYEQLYFARMYRWLMFRDTLYVARAKKRGSQTS